MHGLWALTERDLRKWYTNPYQLIISLIQPVIWMGLFGKALNFSSFITAGAPSGVNANAIMLSFFGTTSYFSYLVCGMLVFIVLFSSTFAGMSVVWDRRFGFMNKALSTPVSRGSDRDGEDSPERHKVARPGCGRPVDRDSPRHGYEQPHGAGARRNIRRSSSWSRWASPGCSSCSR